MGFPRWRTRSGAGQPEQQLRGGVADDQTAASILDRLHSVEWDQLNHAYGPASDVPGELGALTLGTDAMRRAAWTELWGTVHHQGTVYEATVPTVDVMADLAGRREFPDRREALCMLCALAEGNGSHADRVVAAVRTRAHALVANWPHEPELVQRGLLMLSRSVGAVEDSLRREVLPARLEAAWEVGTSRDIWARFGDEVIVDQAEAQRFDSAMDLLSELEDWAFSEVADA